VVRVGKNLKISPDKIAYLKTRVPLTSLIGETVQLWRAGREFIALCPFHHEKTPSFRIYADHAHCFGCGWHGDAIRWLIDHDHLSFIGALDHLAHWCGIAERSASASQRFAKPTTIDAKKNEKALAIWRAGTAIAGSLGEIYFRHRGILIPLPPSLRFHPALYHYPSGRAWPGIVAAVQDPDRRIRGIHQTFLARDGSTKAPVPKPRLRLGSCPGGAIRLGPVEPEHWLIVGEGIENVLSMMQNEALTGWAAMGAGSLPNLILPDKARRIVIAVDNDEHGLGERKAREAAGIWARQGRQVRLLKPIASGDFNDLVKGPRYVA